MFETHLIYFFEESTMHNDWFSGGLSIAKDNVVILLVLLPAEIVEKQ